MDNFVPKTAYQSPTFYLEFKLLYFCTPKERG